MHEGARIEQDKAARARSCARCGMAFGKWTCCEQAWCGACVNAHRTGA